MKSFHVVCAKDNKKIELVLKFNSVEEVKKWLHKQNYSIINIEEIKDEMINKTGLFYFDTIINWKIETWEIQSDNIFKAYIKLIEDLKYNIIYIYENKKSEEREKIINTWKVKEAYKIYLERKWKDTTIKENIISKKEEELPDFLKKELTYYYNLIDEVLLKIEFILNNFNTQIWSEKASKLDYLYSTLKQIKNITNINKLKIIWEAALLKIWELQLELISKNILTSKKEIIKETNKLLKKIWSSKQILLEEDNILSKIKFLIKDFSNFFKNWENNKNELNQFVYYKVLREYNIYKQKLKDINLKILKYTFLFKTTELIKLKIKKKLILQNIQLVKNRLKNNKFSYTKIIKWFEYYKNIILFLLQNLWDLFIYIIFFYLLFFIYINVFTQITISNYIINIIVLISFLGLLLKHFKNLTLIFIWIIFYTIFFIYLTINF